MADSSAKSTGKKRKLTTTTPPAEENNKHKNKKKNKPSLRTHHVLEEDESFDDRGEGILEIDEERPWRNLQLILSLQKKEIDVEKKVELAFNFVKVRAGGEGNDADNEEYETVKMSRMVIFINDWIQSLLISTEKNLKVKGDRDFVACLDFRCWEIFKFCLEKSSELHLSLNLSRNLLRAICYIARNVLSIVNALSLPSKEIFFTGQGFEVYGLVLDCVGMVFSSEGSLSNENLDMWLSTAAAVLELVSKIFGKNLEDNHVGAFVFRFSCLVLEPFSKFLRVHPTRKNGFRDFVDKLLGPSLHLLGLLHFQSDESTPGGTRTLLKLLQAILSHGLFHSTHIDGFLGLRSTENYTASQDRKSKESRIVLKSYHRHLFDKLESIALGKKVLEMSCIGELFSLLVHRVTKQKRASDQLEGGKLRAKTGVSDPKQIEHNISGKMSKKSLGNDAEPPEENHYSSILSAETRKSLFDFFVQLIEPLLCEMHGYIQAGSEMAPKLSDVHCILKSANSLLSSLVQERIYVKTEDISEGACLSFLRHVYSTIFSVASRLAKSYIHSEESKLLIMSAKESIIGVGYLLDIEYEVIDNDIVGIWLLVLSFMAVGLSSESAEDKCSMTSQILGLGCKLIHLYSELRQVDNAIFALCKAVRLMISGGEDDVGETAHARVFSSTASLPYETTAKSVETLFSHQELRLAIHNAIKSIPEGQASGCVRKLTSDISETMEWIKVSSSTADGEELRPLNIVELGTKAQLLGKGLSEVHSLVLEALPATRGNSNLLGLSMNDLMKVIRPYLSSLVSPQSDCVKEFLLAVTGTNLNPEMAGNKSEDYITSTHWFIVFFFRLYMSSRSLYRQVISLMPPKTSKKMAGIMGDAFAACCGNDWMKKNDWNDGGYFSWIAESTASILEVIKCISDTYLKDDVADCCPLIYLLHGMALQRLVDLNGHIKSLDYLSQMSDHLAHAKTLDDTTLSSTRKRSKKSKRHLSILKQEAEDLTNFVLGYLSLVVDNKGPISAPCQSIVQHVNDVDRWNSGVSAINRESLATALWLSLCQNVDIWSSHAAKKRLKKFLSFLVFSSIPCMLSPCNLVGKHSKDEIAQISSELLTDSVLYEHKFVRRYLASSFCQVLANTALQLFDGFQEEKIDFDSSPDWTEVLTALEKSIPISSDKLPTETSMEEDAAGLDIVKFSACQGLLNLLCWIPKEFLKLKSFQVYATYILNLERLIVFTLLKWQHKLSPVYQHNLLSLFVSSRRTLKNIVMASSEKMTGATESPLLPITSNGLSLTLWLFKSVYALIGLQGVLIEGSARNARDVVFSLMDHSSYIFLTMSKYQFFSALPLLMDSEKPHEQNSCSQSDMHFVTSKSDEDYRRMFLLAESMAEQAENLLIPLKDAFGKKKVGLGHNLLNLNKLSSIVSCCGGFLWGLASAVKETDAQNHVPEAKLNWKCGPASKLCHCINVLSDFVDVFTELLFLEDDAQPGNQIDTQIQEFEGKKDSDGRTHFASVEIECLKKPLLQGLVKGDFPEAAFAARQLLIASSAILRLNLHVNGITLSPRLVSIVTGISQVLLSSFADTVKVPHPFSFVWLDGALKCLEELGSHFRLTSPMSNRDVYSRLIELLLRAIGKCICLQGKQATLASHAIESSTKVLHVRNGVSEHNPSRWPYCLDEFKGRLRMSFKVLIEKSSELHLLSAIQAIERALVGVWDVCPAVYRTQTGNTDGGNVSSTVAAGIDCMDLILEHASGRRRINVVKRHIQSLIAALFSIVVHLQSPFIFSTKSVSNEGHNYPDAGSVVLMCVEVLTRVSAKHALFQMDSWHIGQSIRISGAVFQDLLQLRHIGGPASDNYSLLLDNQKYNPVASTSNHLADREFSINLYAACCRLLYTVLKHHKRETEGCLAVLQETVSVLLHCLEMVAYNSIVRKGCFSWKVEEGVKCACFLRRIYEELRQQKDVFGQHCSKFLSTYIWVYSGFGPLKTGIRREVDEALRPGIYALIDACSPNDLQYLHTVFGEGPCRNTLASLQHDYKSNFQYEGKV